MLQNKNVCVCVCVCVCLKMREDIVWPVTKHIIILLFVSLNTENTVFGPLPKRYVCVCLRLCVYSLSIIQPFIEGIMCIRVCMCLQIREYMALHPRYTHCVSGCFLKYVCVCFADITISTIIYLQHFCDT